jgi:hypothetical protein
MAADTWSYLSMFARFPFALRKFARHPLTIERAREIVRERMANRGEMFLQVAEHGIYGNEASPYLKLLRRAGCQLGDLRALVRDKGLEGALSSLRDADVYILFDELKGRKPIIRNGLSLEVKSADFDNPNARRHFTVQTGGSTGLPSLVSQDLDHMAAKAPMHMLLLDAYGLLDVPTSHRSHIMPGTGLRFLLERAYMGQWSEHWYSSLGWRDHREWPKYDAATLYILACARLNGLRIPFPEIVRLDESIVVARWMSETLERHGRCMLAGNVSHALRVALAATKAGLSLRGATFRIGGEPLTPGKSRVFEDAGIQVIGGYGMVEVGNIGVGCPNGIDAGDLHLAMDTIALTTRSHTIGFTGTTVNAFQVTTLSPHSSKLMLNVQVDDYGVVEERTCGCALEAFGYSTHLRDIRSYSKLVGEGVTLIGNEMVEILETVLPRRFGGSPLDYQILEEEDEQHLTRIFLLVSPRVRIDDESKVIEALHEALRDSSAAAGAASAVWKDAGSIRIRRADPVLTARGKMMPLHIDRSVSSRG